MTRKPLKLCCAPLTVRCAITIPNNQTGESFPDGVTNTFNIDHIKRYTGECWHIRNTSTTVVMSAASTGLQTAQVSLSLPANTPDTHVLMPWTSVVFHKYALYIDIIRII
jgi:hypothetical protein